MARGHTNVTLIAHVLAHIRADINAQCSWVQHVRQGARMHDRTDQSEADAQENTVKGKLV